MPKLYRYQCNDCQRPYYYLKAVQNHMVKHHNYLWWDNRDICKRQDLNNPTGPILPQTLGEDMRELWAKLDAITGEAIIKMLEDGRFYTNWRTRDEQANWTVKDFRPIKWPEDVGTIASTSAMIVHAIYGNVVAELQRVRQIEYISSKYNEHRVRAYVARLNNDDMYLDEEVEITACDGWNAAMDAMLQYPNKESKP